MKLTRLSLSLSLSLSAVSSKQTWLNSAHLQSSVVSPVEPNKAEIGATRSLPEMQLLRGLCCLGGLVVQLKVDYEKRYLYST